MIPLLYNHVAKFPIINNNTVLLLPFLLHACCRFYCIIVAILYVSLLADFTVFVLSDYKWYDYISEPTLADAILDRLLANASRIELKGDSMRRKTNKK